MGSTGRIIISLFFYFLLLQPALGQQECKLNKDNIFCTYGSTIECANGEKRDYKDFCLKIRVRSDSPTACILTTICDQYSIHFQVKPYKKKNEIPTSNSTIACAKTNHYIILKTSNNYQLDNCEKNIQDFVQVQIRIPGLENSTKPPGAMDQEEENCFQILGKCHKILNLLIMGGIIGTTILIIFIIILIACCCRRRQRKKKWETQKLSEIMIKRTNNENSGGSNDAFDEYVGMKEMPRRDMLTPVSPGQTQDSDSYESPSENESESELEVSHNPNNNPEYYENKAQEREPYENHVVPQPPVTDDDEFSQSDDDSSHDYVNVNGVQER